METLLLLIKMMNTSYILLLLIHIWSACGIKISIETRNDAGSLPRFWDSTGFCPPDPHQSIEEYVLSPDMEQNLALIGSLPNHGLRQVRVHWLLDLIQFNIQNNLIEYNFTRLDKFIYLLHSYGLKPGFELMGNPSNYFENFETPGELKEWEQLITALVKRYINIYGQEYVSEWNFELWNEPDHRKFDGINLTLSSYLNLFQATWTGLQQSGLKSIKLGGPADKCLPIEHNRHSLWCWSLLAFISKPNNSFMLDYISIHEKGKEDDLLTILKSEAQVIHEIDSKYTKLKHVPVFNDEADPLKLWSEPKWWRADSNYATLLAINIIEHIHAYYNRSSKLYQRVKLISHDNAFLSYYPYQFTQRTLLARFQINNTQPRYTQFIRKPVYSVLGLFALLGETLLSSHVSQDFQSQIRLIATKHKLDHSNYIKNAYMVLLSNGHPSVFNISSAVTVEMKIKLSTVKLGDSYHLARYVVDNVYTNPYLIWKNNNCPDFPSSQLLKEMKNAEEPVLIESQELIINHNVLSLQFDLNYPSVSLLILCPKLEEFKEQVNNVKVIHVTKNSILILWASIKSPCLKTYQIEYSQSDQEEDFRAINEWRLIFPSFQYTSEGSINGYYRIVAIDFWNRLGIYSKMIKI